MTTARSEASPLANDVARSMRNAVTLGASLVATWAVALGVRIFLPRHLGPAAFGAFQFADSFTAAIFILTGLGVETYVRKEISARVEHASDFFGGTLLARIGVSVVVMLVALASLTYAGKSPQVRELVLILGLAQILINVNLTYAALLQAVGTVRGLSALQVISKLIWAVGIFAAFALGGGIRSVAVAMLVSECFRAVGLVILAQRHVALRYTIDVAATVAVLSASLPYYLAALAINVYSRIDVSVMSFLTSDTEVGWYGAASSLAGMAMLLSPIIGWVLLPLASRAAARSEAEFILVGRRTMELVLCIAIPVSLFIYLAASDFVLRMFGEAYAPAVPTMRILAPTFVLTYVAIVSASLLTRLERAWAVTWITTAGMVASPLLNLWLIPQFARLYGRGGPGIGAAIALVITEACTTLAMTWLLRGRVFDRRSVVVLTKTCIACAAVIAFDLLLSPLGAWRLALDALLYAGLVIGSNALDLRGMLDITRHAFAARTAPATQQEAS